MEEVGELARIMSRTYGEQSFKGKVTATDLGDELADVLFVLVCIANQTGVDLEAAISKNLQKKTARDIKRFSCRFFQDDPTLHGRERTER